MTTGRVLLAGGTGRLGSIVTAGLAAEGVQVRVLTRRPERAAHLLGNHVEVVAGDVRDAASLGPATAGVDVVVSAVHGFATGGSSPASVDRDGNIHLIDAARSAGAQMVLMSTVGAASDSPFELFRMKYVAEQYLADSGIPATVLRSTAFLELWIDILTDTASRSGRPLIFGRGNNPINVVPVRDVAVLLQQLITDPTTRGLTLEIGGPDNPTMTDLADRVSAQRGSPATPRHVPRPVLHVIAATLAALRPALAGQARAALAMDRYDMTFTATPASTATSTSTSAEALPRTVPIPAPASPRPDAR